MLAEMTAPEAQQSLTERSVVVIPIGAIEQHGPHLPLNTDIVVPEAVTHAAVPRAVAMGVDAWILPALAYSKSDEHHWAPGTVWLSARTFTRTVIDIGRSVAKTPAKTIVFVNGHGGNTALLQTLNRELRRRFGLRSFSLGTGTQRAGTGVDGEPDEAGMGIHAGFSETSLMLHLRPDLVRLDLAARAVPVRLLGYDLLSFTGAAVAFGWLSDDFGPDGVIGDPTRATAAAGAVMFEEGVEFVARALDQISRFVAGEEAAAR